MNNSIIDTAIDREFPITLAAGETFSYPGYEFVRIQSITGAAEIRVKTNRGDDLHLGQSQSHRFKGEPIRELIIENEAGVPVTLLLLLANGEFTDPELSGTVTVSSIVTPPTIQAITDPSPPHPLGTNYTRLNASAALVTIVTPAANTAGVIVYGCHIASAAWARVMAKTSAPASYSDAAANTIAANASNSYVAKNNEQVMPVLVPIGMGLYEQNSGASTTFVSVNYEVL